METTPLKRKQRLARLRKEKMKARNKKIAAVTVAGAITAITFLSTKAGACGEEYTVKKNDTLYSLSKKYQVSIGELMEVNGLESGKIFAGQMLNVPSIPEEDEPGFYTVQKGDTLFSLAKQYHVPVSELKKENTLVSDKILVGQKLAVPLELHKNSQEAIYTVIPGDTLWGIAHRFGVAPEELAKENGLNKNMVLIGQQIIIPGESSFSDVKVVGAADNFTVEFEEQGEPLVLQVAYGTASGYQKKAGKNMTVVHKNGAVVDIF